jgi:hypothetical protein
MEAGSNRGVWMHKHLPVAPFATNDTIIQVVCPVWILSVMGVMGGKGEGWMSGHKCETIT